MKNKLYINNGLILQCGYMRCLYLMSIPAYQKICQILCTVKFTWLRNMLYTAALGASKENINILLLYYKYQV